MGIFSGNTALGVSQGLSSVMNDIRAQREREKERAYRDEQNAKQEEWRNKVYEDKMAQMRQEMKMREKLLAKKDLEEQENKPKEALLLKYKIAKDRLERMKEDFLPYQDGTFKDDTIKKKMYESILQFENELRKIEDQLTNGIKDPDLENDASSLWGPSSFGLNRTPSNKSADPKMGAVGGRYDPMSLSTVPLTQTPVPSQLPLSSVLQNQNTQYDPEDTPLLRQFKQNGSKAPTFGEEGYNQQLQNDFIRASLRNVLKK